MSKYSYLLCLVLCLFACKSKEQNPEEVVGNVAKQYYSYLLEGKYDAFVDGCYQKDSIRNEYRQQLIDNAKMFVAQQEKAKQGIKAADVKSVAVDTARHTADVFLVLTYGDKTTEQVLLPMVEKGDIWYMR